MAIFFLIKEKSFMLTNAKYNFYMPDNIVAYQHQTDQNILPRQSQVKS
jgi:hypothetical protein